MNRFDVVIIGAGPAGLRCAEILAGSNLSVAVIDRLKHPGIKPCGGGITPRNPFFRKLSGGCREFRRQRIIINNRSFDVDIPEPIRVIDRAELARYQLEQVSGASNIKLFTGVGIDSVSSGSEGMCVTGVEGERFYCGYLVGADGSHSVTRSALGLGRRRRAGLHCRLVSDYERMTWYFNPAVIGDGYCWVFPHRDFLSCGAYFNPEKVSGSDALAAMKNFLEGCGLKFESGTLEGFPILSEYEGFRFGNTFLCGDAAAAAFPATGEGISPAVFTGEAAARCILGDDRWIPKIDSLLRYRRLQQTGLRVLELLRSHALQSAALEALVRFGCRYCMY